MSFGNSKLGHASFATGCVEVVGYWSWDKVRCSTERDLILELWAGAQSPRPPVTKEARALCHGSSHYKREPLIRPLPRTKCPSRRTVRGKYDEDYEVDC